MKKKLHDIAAAFDMTVDGFAKAAGYTRQHLYLSSKNGVKNPCKLRVAIDRLEWMSEKVRQLDYEGAEYRYLNRQKAIEEFEKFLCGEGGEDETLS